MEIWESCQLRSSSLGSDQCLHCKGMWECPHWARTSPGTRALSGPKRSLRKTFKGKIMIPSPHSPDLLPRTNCTGGFSHHPWKPVHSRYLGLSFQLVGGGDWTPPGMIRRLLWNQTPPVLITWFDVCFYEPGPLCLSYACIDSHSYPFSFTVFCENL